MHVFGEREREIDYKELAHAIMGPSADDIFRQARSLVSRPDIQVDLVSPPMSRSWGSRLETQARFPCFGPESSFLSWEASTPVSFPRPLADWMRPTHVVLRDLLI